MPAKKPTENQLRLLTDVADGKVQRTWYGWSVASAPSTSAESRSLRTFRDEGWIATPSRRPLQEPEAEAATVTGTGMSTIARYWPQWKPQAATATAADPGTNTGQPAPHAETRNGESS